MTHSLADRRDFFDFLVPPNKRQSIAHMNPCARTLPSPLSLNTLSTHIQTLVMCIYQCLNTHTHTHTNTHTHTHMHQRARTHTQTPLSSLLKHTREPSAPGRCRTFEFEAWSEEVLVSDASTSETSVPYIGVSHDADIVY